MKQDTILLRAARKLKNNLSQAEVGRAVGLSEPTIRRIEAGNPKVESENVALVAIYLGLAFDKRSKRVFIPPEMPESDANKLRDMAGIPRKRRAMKVMSSDDKAVSVLPDPSKPVKHHKESRASEDHVLQ